MKKWFPRISMIYAILMVVGLWGLNPQMPLTLVKNEGGDILSYGQLPGAEWLPIQLRLLLRGFLKLLEIVKVPAMAIGEGLKNAYQAASDAGYAWVVVLVAAAFGLLLAIIFKPVLKWLKGLWPGKSS